MGCCQSAEREAPDSSPRADQSVSSANHANPLPTEASRPSVARSLRSDSNGDSSSILPPPDARLNQPIRAPTPLATSPAHIAYRPPPWTRTQLEREREAFFDTRVSGNDEIWKALRIVSELVRKDEIVEAQGILDALNLTCPSGKIAGRRSKSRHGENRHREKGGIYDERGQLYDIPAWVLTDPQDIVEDEEKDATDGAADESDEQATAAARRRDEKGKGRAEDPGEMVRLRVRLSDRGTDVTVSVGMKEKMVVVIKSVQDQIGKMSIRLLYLGKVLDEQSTLEQSAWKHGHVINAMVFAEDDIELSKSRSKFFWYNSDG